MRLSRSSSLQALLLGLAASILGFFFFQSGLEDGCVDLLLPAKELAQNGDPDEKIAVCLIDPDSFKRYDAGNEKIHRREIGRLIRKLQQLGASAIAFTFPLIGPFGVGSPEEIRKVDEGLQKDIQALDRRIVLAAGFPEEVKSEDETRQLLDAAAVESDLHSFAIPGVDKIQWNYRMFAEVAGSQAPDHLDGRPSNPLKCRTSTLIFDYKRRHFPSLALRAVAIYRQPPHQSEGSRRNLMLSPRFSIPLPFFEIRQDLPRLQLGRQEIAVGPEARIRINYRDRGFRSLTMYQVLEEEVAKDFFADRLVFVGVKLRDEEKEINTPYGVMTRAEVHANIASNLLREDYIREGTVSIYLLSLAALLGLASLLPLIVFHVERKRVALVLGLLPVMLWWIGCGIALRSGVHLPILPPTVAGLLAFAGAWLVQSHREEKDREKLRQDKERAEVERETLRREKEKAEAEREQLRREKEKAEEALRRQRERESHDVFLCHNSSDKPAVREIADRLEAHGIRTWLDERDLLPGRPWGDELEKMIETTSSAAVFVGDEGLGPWQSMEYRALLQQFVQRGCPVIPVVLKHARKKPKLPLFLQGFTWVDFRQQEPDPLEVLIRGITGKKRGREAATAPDPASVPGVDRLEGGDPSSGGAHRAPSPPER